MEYDWIGAVVALATAFGAGSVVTKLMDRGKERRAARAAVLAAVHRVERAQWEVSTTGFDGMLRELRTTALLARLPRAPVDEYVELARVTRRLSRWAKEEPDLNRWDPYFEMAVTTAAEIVVDLIWHPVLGRFRMRRARSSMIADLNQLEPGLQAEVWGHSPWG